MSVLLVALGASLGGALRYLLDTSIQRAHRLSLPLGTLCVNLLASFVLGVLVAHQSTRIWLLGAAGFCGALSTFSTFAFEVVRLSEERQGRGSVSYVIATLAFSLAAVYAGALL